MLCRYVTIKKFSELSGYTEDAIRAKMCNGVWIEGIHFKRGPDRKPLMDIEEYYRWVEEGYTPGLKRAASQ